MFALSVVYRYPAFLQYFDLPLTDYYIYNESGGWCWM